jgi:tetratricopeptide (TPR) repeat protein
MKEVSIVVAADGPDKILATAQLEFDEMPSSGDTIQVKYRLDANKVLEVEACLEERPDVRCGVTLENPLSATAVKDANEQKILELEQKVGQLMTGGSKREQAETMEELGNLNRMEKRHEKAISWYQNTLRVRDEADPWVLSSIAGCYVYLNESKRAEKAYREALKAAPESAPIRFNLSLHLETENRLDEALEEAVKASDHSQAQTPYTAWKGILLQKKGKKKTAKEALEKALEEFEYLEPGDEWSLHWWARTYEALGKEDEADHIKKKLAAARDMEPEPIDRRKLPGQTPGQLGKN